MSVEEVEEFQSSFESQNTKRFKSLKAQLIAELRANALDYENPPTEAIKDMPHPMYWVPETDPNHETNPKGQNSLWMLNAIKVWELEIPAMSLTVHGGSQHPMHLIQDKGLREQRKDFLQSRPRFNDDYFDGQRDPVEGWMAAVNAWRYPAFFVGPHYQMPEFTFKPPHTLFIDASLQAQDDAELIGKMDRVNNEWIMDAVTHQPLGKQVAIKDDDGVFYWDLNVKQAVTPGGVLPQQTQYVGNMRQSYDEWYQGMKDQWITLKENNPTMQSMLQARSKHLVKTTRPKNLRSWLRMTNLMLIHDIRRAENEKERELERGEVRLEIKSSRLNEIGLKILAAMGPEFAAGDALVLVESMIPGDNPPEHLSEPYPLRKGFSTFKGRAHDQIERRYRTENSEAETLELTQILEDVDPSSSDVTIKLIVANKQGRKWYITDRKGTAQLKGFIGITKISLKELLRDGKPNNNGTCEMDMAFDLMGFEEMAPKGSPAPKALPPPHKAPPQLARSSVGSVVSLSPSATGSGWASLRRMSLSKVGPIDEELEDTKEEEEEEDISRVEVPVGVVMLRIAIRPPESLGIRKKGSKMESTLPSPREDDTTNDAGAGVGACSTRGGSAGCALRATASSSSRSKYGLSPQWSEATAPDGRTYYYCTEDGSTKTQWTSPYEDGESIEPSMASMAEDNPLSQSGVREPPSLFEPGWRDVVAGRGPVPVVPGWPTSTSGSEPTPPPSPPDEPPNARSRRTPSPNANASREGSNASSSCSKTPDMESGSQPQPTGARPLQPTAPSIPVPEAVEASLMSTPALYRYAVAGEDQAEPSRSRKASLDSMAVPEAAEAAAGEDPAKPINAKSNRWSRLALRDVVGTTAGVRAPRPVNVPADSADTSEKASKQRADAAPVASHLNQQPTTLSSGNDAGMHAAGNGGTTMRLMSTALAYMPTKDTLCYTFAYWIKWRPIESLSDQLLFFGETRNMPALVRNNQLGALVDNVFCATDFDPRLAGDNWCLLVVTNDGRESQFWIGYHSIDTKGAPQPARALLPEPKRPATYVSTEMDASVQIRRLVTSSKGAGLLAQAWIWPRDLTKDEILELWIETKSRYPLWKPGFSQYRPAPQPMSAPKKPPAARPSSSKKPSSSGSERFGVENDGEPPLLPRAATLPWDRYDPLIEKDNAAMLDPSLASKLAFQRLKNVFSVLIDYATFSQVFLVIDKNQNSSPTAELMIEIALRGNTGLNPKVVVMDSRPRLERAAAMLQALIECKFLIDQELAYKKLDAPEEQKVTEYKLTSIDYATPRADLRRLVTPAGLAWLRASAQELDQTVQLIDSHPNHPGMCKRVIEIFREYQYDVDLQPDRRPIIGRIWRIFYDAQLFASGTNYIIFDSVDFKAKPIISVLGTIGAIFMHGSTAEHRKIVDCIQEGSPFLLLESTGGIAQAFSYIIKAVRLMKPKWDIDFVMRLITEYKQRAAKNVRKERMTKENRKLALDNIILLDKELARVDLLLSAGEHSEHWMRSFGLPEALMLFEIWQRSPDFVMKQFQTADVMKRSAESLLDLFTSCFSSAGSPPELGLGNAETKVVATAWSRHLVLFNNAEVYNLRSWSMQCILYICGLLTTMLSVITQIPALSDIWILNAGMLVLPIFVALLGTVSTRLRQRQKFSVAKMASYEIVSEIYKFRTRSMEYDGQALAESMRAAQEGPTDKKKKGDDEPVAPISAKVKDKLARTLFVQRVQSIYLNTGSELSKGASVSHTTGGLDASRLLVDEVDGDAQRKTLEALQHHVASRIYFVTLREWALTAEVVRKEKELANDVSRTATRRYLRRTHMRLMSTVVGIFVSMVGAVILSIGRCSDCIYGLIPKAKRLQMTISGGEVEVVEMEMVAASKEGDEVKSVDQRITELSSEGRSAERLVRQMKGWHLKSKTGVSVVPAAASAHLVEAAESNGEDPTWRGERLETRYLEEDGTGADAAAAGADVEQGGGAVRVKDDMMTSMNIDDYMQYRARPILSYFEKTAPWRAFELQCLEVVIFCISSAGAVLVGLNKELAPYVALTVAVSFVCKSAIEFTRLDKQVETYNKSQRELHNLLNQWDGMTRTERRTRSTIKQVVGTVETAMLNVAMALTDAMLTGTEGGRDGEEMEGKKE